MAESPWRRHYIRTAGNKDEEKDLRKRVDVPI